MSDRQQSEREAVEQLAAYVASRRVDIALAATDPRNTDQQGGRR